MNYLTRTLTRIEQETDFQNYPLIDEDGDDTGDTRNVLEVTLSKLQWVREHVAQRQDHASMAVVDDIESILQAMIKDNKKTKEWK